MKIKKLLGVTLLMGSLMVAGCDKKPAESKPASTTPSASQPASGTQASASAHQSASAQNSASAQQSTSNSSQAQTDPEVTVTKLAFETKTNKVYITAEGTATGYTAANFKWAWGILTGGGQGQGQGGQTEITDDAFIYGKATPAAGDYKAVTLGNGGAFKAELCISDVVAAVTDFKPALYTVYGGTPDKYGPINPTDEATSGKDNDYKFYFRADQNAIAIDAIPAVAFEIATVYVPTNLPSGKTEDLYVKIGGAVKADVNINDLEVSADFQRVPQYAKIDINNETEFFWTTEGDKAYVNLYIGGMAVGDKYMTHLGFNVPETTTPWGMTQKNIPNCYMENDINDVAYEFAALGKKVTVNAKQSEGQSGEFYGCLGFRIEALESVR